MKKIILINASPRKNKSCDTICKYIKANLEKYPISLDYFEIRYMNFTGCIDCGYCKKNKGCIINDDIQNIYDKFDNSDGTIIVTPIYFDSTPWKLKALVDRMQAIYNSKYIIGDSLIDRNKKRKGFYVSVGGAQEYETQFVGNQLVMEFMYKSINTTILDHIKISGTDEKTIDETSGKINDIEAVLSKML